MSRTVIKVENLSKQYRLGQVGTGTLHHDVNRWWHRMRGKGDPYLKVGEENDRTVKGESDYVWALKDISFDVKEGKVVGIIGRNGAGKSTLLKILSRTTAPTKGQVKVKGRIASLLEVGTGFHPDLSGRENVYLNGAILGMTRAEIRKKFDEIVDFAGVERYIDTPVKRYSSGMYVRLAFGVAAHLEPEILIVDEVLSVGDIEFQKKALGKMHDVSEQQGRTVLFVSHNLSSLRSLCNHGISMKNGHMQQEGDMIEIIHEYERSLQRNLRSEWFNVEGRDQEMTLHSIRILDDSMNTRADFLTTEKVMVEMELKVREQIKNVKVGFDLIKNNEIAFRSQQVDSNSSSHFQPGEYTLVCTIPANLLNEGEYFLKPLLSVHCVKDLMYLDECVISFNIKMDTNISAFHQVLNERNHPGLIYPALHWNANR